MKKNKKGLWFRAKHYGWGWYPVTWQGWTIIAVFILAILGNYKRLEAVAITERELMKFFIPETIVLTLILIWISYKKGEKPEWRWGNKKIA